MVGRCEVKLGLVRYGSVRLGQVETNTMMVIGEVRLLTIVQNMWGTVRYGSVRWSRVWFSTVW